MKKKRKLASVVRTEAPIALTTAPVGWTFLSNHTHVLLCLYRDRESTLRQVALLVGITERMVQKIVAELVQAEYLKVTKTGRRNSYEIRLEKKLRHPLESHRCIGDVLQSLDRPK